MKDVNEILSRRLQLLEKPFSREWISDFHAFMNLLLTHLATSPIVQALQQEKIEDHKALIQSLKQLVLDGKESLKQLLLQCQDNSELFASINPKITALLKTAIDPKRAQDPFFEFESIFHDYCKDFSAVLKEVASIDANHFVSQYAILSCIKIYDTVHLNTHLVFSKAIQECKNHIEILSGRRATKIWGRWDLLLRWVEWTKDGVSPTNEPCARNLSYMFHGQKVSETVQSLGLYLREHVSNIRPESSIEQPVKGLELFLDENHLYWIILHSGGEYDDKKPYFIKKLRQSSRSYNLLQQLLKLDPYSGVKSTYSPHSLGEIELKNEIGKVFFPHDKFAGPFVSLGAIDCSINTREIIDHLNLIESRKKNRPSFNWGCYHRSKSSSKRYNSAVFPTKQGFFK